MKKIKAKLDLKKITISKVDKNIRESVNGGGSTVPCSDFASCNTYTCPPGNTNTQITCTYNGPIPCVEQTGNGCQIFFE